MSEKLSGFGVTDCRKLVFSADLRRLFAALAHTG
jgi:hypothetical protein